MTPKGDALDESTVIIREIESGLESSLRQKREQIERELEEQLRRGREESERKLAEIEREFEKEKGSLREYHDAVAEFEEARDGLEAEIRERLDRSAAFQKEIEKLTSQTGDELRTVADISGRLADLRLSAERKIGDMRARLKEKFPGAAVIDPARPAKPVPAHLPASAESAEADAEARLAPPSDSLDAGTGPSGDEREFVFDLEKELGKLKKIKEMLDQDGGSACPGASFLPSQTSAVPEPSEDVLPPHPEEAGWPSPRTEPAAEMRMPEINQFIQDFVQREQGSAALAAAPASFDEADFAAVFAALEKYRRSEPTDYSGEISFFQNRDHLILDGESLLRAVDTVTAEARKLFGRLGQAGTPKDQFFIKQELINNQEILRKIVLRSVRMCERESCRLPRYTADILNAGVLKDLLERLNMDNWSNQDDFAAFEAVAGQLKDAFPRRITPPARYLHSVIQELEG